MGDVCAVSACPYSPIYWGFFFFSKTKIGVCWAALPGRSLMTQEHDAFSRFHPAVNFIFFSLALVFGMIFLHPAYISAAILGSSLYYLSIQKFKGIKTIAGLLPLFALIALVNPLFNTQGQQVLFFLGRRPYTLEALLYGAALAGMFLSILLWFFSYNAVMTSDKFTTLFGSLIPALSLILVMILRLVPSYQKKAGQITSARKCLGRSGQEGSLRQRAASGMGVLSALVSWALESSVVTADSMRSRGYGAGRRTSFAIYRFRLRDGLLLLVMAALSALVIAAAVRGAATAAYTPELSAAPLHGTLFILGFGAHMLLLLTPTLLNLQEDLTWRILRSRI